MIQFLAVIAATLCLTVNSTSLQSPTLYPSSLLGNGTSNSTSIVIELERNDSNNETVFLFSLSIGTYPNSTNVTNTTSPPKTFVASTGFHSLLV